jgi:hypothetical protein
MKKITRWTIIYLGLSFHARAQTLASHTDEEAIKQVITSETNAYLMRDSNLLISYYADDPITISAWNEPNGSFGTFSGLQMIRKNMSESFREHPSAPYQPEFKRSDWFFRPLGSDWMWVNYKEKIPMANGKIYNLYETRVMKREASGWKIAVMLALSDHGIKK